MTTMPLKGRVLRRVSPPPANAPTSAEVEKERSIWGPHPDPAIGRIEEAFYQVGHRFLVDLYTSALGIKPPRGLMKALGPRLPGVSAPVPPADFGALAKLFKQGGNPLELRDEWSRLIERIVGALFPRHTQEDAANAMAIQAHWLGRVRTRTDELAGVPPPKAWHQAVNMMERRESLSMEWTKTRALEACRDLEEDARTGLRNVLIRSKQAGEGTQGLARRCFDTFGDLNRDWRRTALTETAAAHSNGQLAACDPEEEWEAEWSTARGGCPWCSRWQGRRFKVVQPDDPRKDGQTQVWAGKTNEGRSGSRTTRSGRVRTEAELYYPCIPCHPHCACGYIMRRIRNRLAA